MALVSRKEEPLELNLTAMIDVVFLLIIFFMGAATFSEDAREIDLQLPTVADAKMAQSLPTARVIEIHRDGELMIDAQATTLPELRSQLQDAKAADPAVTVSVMGDAGVAFQHVAAVMAACKSVGIRDLAVSVQIATE